MQREEVAEGEVAGAAVRVLLTGSALAAATAIASQQGDLFAAQVATAFRVGRAGGLPLAAAVAAGEARDLIATGRVAAVAGICADVLWLPAALGQQAVQRLRLVAGQTRTAVSLDPTTRPAMLVPPPLW